MGNERLVSLVKTELFEDMLIKLLSNGRINQEFSVSVIKAEDGGYSVEVADSDMILMEEFIRRILQYTDRTFKGIKEFVEKFELLGMGIFDKFHSPSGKHVYSYVTDVQYGEMVYMVYLADLHIFKDDEKIKEFVQSVHAVRNFIK